MVLAGERGVRSRSPHNADTGDIDTGAGLDMGRGRAPPLPSSIPDIPQGASPLPDIPGATIVDFGGASPTPPGSANISLASVDKIVEKAFNNQISTFRDSMAAALDAPIRAVVTTACAEQLQAVEGRLTSLESGQNKLLEEVAKINLAVAKMAHSPSAPALPTPYGASQPTSAGDVTTSPFWRTPDPTCLFINVHDRVKLSLRTIYKSFVELATDANIAESDYTFQGDQLDNRFDVKFTGPAAAKHCLQFYQSLQLGRGRWKTQEASDPSNNMHRYYIVPDKNPAQVRKEVLAKQLQKGIAGLQGWAKDIFVRKSSGTLLVDRRPLVSINVIDENQASLVWSHANRISNGLDQGAIEQMFRQLVDGGSSP